MPSLAKLWTNTRIALNQRPLLRGILAFLAAVGIFVLIRVTDPQGISRTLERFAETNLSRLYGAWHPGGWCWSHCQAPAGRDRVTVALIDQNTLDIYRKIERPDAPPGHAGWPPSFATYARMVDAIVGLHARLIFLDLSISPRDDGSSPQPLIDAFHRARDSNVTILLGQIDPAHEYKPFDCLSGDTRLGGRTDPRLACAATKTVPISWQNEIGLVWYPFTVGDEAGPEDGATSPAVAIVQAIEPSPAAEKLSHEHKEDLFLGWPPDDSYDGDCRHAPHRLGRTLAQRVGDALWVFVPPFLAEDDESCPYVPEVPVWEIGQPGTNLDPLISGRAVIVGVKNVGYMDIHQAPDGHNVPGAAFHATAVENLITFKVDHAWRYEAYTPGWHLPEAILAAIIVFVIKSRREFVGLLRVRRSEHKSHRRRRSRLHRAGRYLGLLAAAAAFGAALAMAASYIPFLHLPKANVFAIILLVVLIETGMNTLGSLHELVGLKKGQHHHGPQTEHRSSLVARPLDPGRRRRTDIG